MVTMPPEEGYREQSFANAYTPRAKSLSGQQTLNTRQDSASRAGQRPF
jgi:hypothetical protein